jgi:hypothetical protein
LIGLGILILGGAGFDLHSALALKQTRLAELRSRRLNQQDLEMIEHLRTNVLAPETGLLIVRDDDAVLRLKQIVEELAQQHGAELHSISLAADLSNTKIPTIRGTLRLIVSEDNLGSLVRAFEFGSPTVFLDHLRIASSSLSGEEAGSALLDVHCTISVYKDDPWPKEHLP